MALDPNIILRGVQGFQQPDLGAAAQQGLKTVGIFQKMRNEQELAPLRKSILEGQAAGLALANEKNEQALALQKENRDLVNLYSFYQRNKGRFERGEYEAIAQDADAVAQQRIDEGQSEADISDTRMIADVMRSQDSEAITNLFKDGAKFGDLLERRGLLEEDVAKVAEPAAVQEFRFLTQAMQSDDPRMQEAASIQLGLSPDASARLRQKQAQSQAVMKQHELNLKQQAEQRQQQKLSATLEKALLTAQDESVNASRSATEFDILADQVSELDLSGGLLASTTETFKQLLGTQDDVTELRRRFNKVRLSEGLKNLPPGPATDRDVKEAFKGVPPENAPASQIASFLRGAAKMARFDAAYNQFKSDFISDKNTTKGINREWRKKVRSNALDRDITIAEIYAEAVLSGLNIEDIKAELGVSE
jgi:hypothetical protein